MTVGPVGNVSDVVTWELEASLPGKRILCGYRKKRCLPVSRLHRKHFVSVQLQSAHVELDVSDVYECERVYIPRFLRHLQRPWPSSRNTG
jgi:hypothetical protein